MKERYVFILISVFLVSVLFFTNFDNVFTGKAGGAIGGDEGCTECGDGTPANTCVDGDPPIYCLEEAGSCSLVVACTICGCDEVTPHCNEDAGFAGLGACENPTCGDGLCEGDEDSSNCCNDCGCDDGSSCESNECVVELCGNGAVDPGEECDSSSTGKSCSDFGYDTGSLSCSGCSYVTSGCANYEDDNPSGATLQDNCASVNGVCTDSCLSGYSYPGNINYDRKCEVTYGDGLICCVPDYSGGDSSGGDVNDIVQESTSIIGVEQFVIDEENGVQKSAASLNEYQGVEKLLLSPSYAMGGVWIVFILTVLVVGISFYVHGRIYRKK